MAQDTSDPLPYTQVDRAAKPKAALLAGLLGVTTQHALGSLVEFWDLCGDPRTLEELLASGTPEVVLTGEEVVSRFALASGKTIDPASLVTLGLAEPRPDGSFRVRGMSRMFAPIRRRLQARQAAKAGGLATAAKATRVGGRFAKAAGAPAGEPPGRASSDHQAATKRPPGDGQAEHQAEHQAPTSTADSGQRTAAVKKKIAGEGRPAAGYQDLVDALFAAFVAARGKPPEPRDKDWAALKRLRERTKSGDGEIVARFKRGLAAQFKERTDNFLDLDERWDALAGSAAPPQPRSPDAELGRNELSSGECADCHGVFSQLVPGSDGASRCGECATAFFQASKRPASAGDPGPTAHETPDDIVEVPWS